ncbi:MAG: hypothetical protein WAK84_09370 [Candidatus Cybelea sp.]
MTLRKVPGVLALGLLASLGAHAVVYRGEHAMGGPYHFLVVQGAVAFSVTLLAFFGALAWSGRRAADGSVLAVRLRDQLPSWFWILPAAAVWYGVAETIEPHHAPASSVVVVASLAAAACVVLRLARGIVRALARAIIAVSSDSFSPRTPHWLRHRGLRLTPRRLLWARRRFARPPPIVIVLSA